MIANTKNENRNMKDLNFTFNTSPLRHQNMVTWSCK